MDFPTLERWIGRVRAGFAVQAMNADRREGSRRRRAAALLRPAQRALGAALDAAAARAASSRADDLGRRLLAANREMRVAKFALGADGAVVLCAELPTESLDESELADASSGW